jgi:23S rRNA (cytidine1920-2'-O)/16S rRNA (cytidine1409-2'-O)-methyltransferase
MAMAGPDCWLVALVKPQFEAGRDAVGKGGIVRDEATRTGVVANFTDLVSAAPGWKLCGVIPSPIDGGSGNAEYLMGMIRNE